MENVNEIPENQESSLHQRCQKFIREQFEKFIQLNQNFQKDSKKPVKREIKLDIDKLPLNQGRASSGRKNECKRDSHVISRTPRQSNITREKLKRDVDELLKSKSIKSHFATDWEPNYKKILTPRPGPFRYKPAVEIVQYREILRKNFSLFYGREANLEITMKQEKLELYFKEFEHFRNMCDNDNLGLFKHWKDLVYNAANEKSLELDSLYDITSPLQEDLKQIRKTSTRLYMKIFGLEGDLIRRIKCQNFLFSIADHHWRIENDWVHQNQNGNLEDLRDSIMNRSHINIRDHDESNDVWNVKKYYEEVFLKTFPESKFPFNNSEELSFGIYSFKLKMYKPLVNLHLKIWVLVNAQREFDAFNQQSFKNIQTQKNFVDHKCKDRNMLAKKCESLKPKGMELLTKTLEISAANSDLVKIKAVCEVMFEELIPNSDLTENLNVVEKFSALSDKVLFNLTKLDQVPTHIREDVENQIRSHRKVQMRLSVRALAKEKNVHSILDALKRNLAKHIPKPVQRGKLPRAFLRPKRQAPLPIKTDVVTPEMKIFYDAFSVDGTGRDVDVTTPENIEIMNSVIRRNVPCYFEKILKLLDHEPVFDFKTQVELRDGDEEKRLQFKDVLEVVRNRLKQWETYKKIEMEHFLNNSN